MNIVDACIIAATIVAVALCGIAVGVIIATYTGLRRMSTPLDGGIDSDSESSSN